MKRQSACTAILRCGWPPQLRNIPEAAQLGSLLESRSHAKDYGVPKNGRDWLVLYQARLVDSPVAGDQIMPTRKRSRTDFEQKRASSPPASS